MLSTKRSGTTQTTAAGARQIRSQRGHSNVEVPGEPREDPHEAARLVPREQSVGASGLHEAKQVKTVRAEADYRSTHWPQKGVGLITLQPTETSRTVNPLPFRKDATVKRFHCTICKKIKRARELPLDASTKPDPVGTCAWHHHPAGTTHGEFVRRRRAAQPHNKRRTA